MKLLVKQAEFLSEGVHIGTKQKNKQMEKFVYKVRPNGLAVLNLQLLSDRLRVAAKFLSKFDPKKILVVATREEVAKVTKKFADQIGANSFVSRFPPGSLTNPSYEKFVEPDVVLVTNPIADRQAIREASKIGVPVVAMCDTNNSISEIDFVIPCNNKGKRSVAFMYWLLGREILKNRKEKGKEKGKEIKKSEEYISFKEFVKDAKTKTRTKS